MKKNAFTLIEMVVVILILGIMAAVAAPKMFNTAETAAENATRSQLNIVRNALELYAAEHDGLYPAPTESLPLETMLTKYINGAFPAPQVGATKGSKDVLVVTGVAVDASASVDENEAMGWVYNSDTGKFVINSDDVSSDGVTTLNVW
ncbi:MAG: type II secretion system protein [Pirellulaceae bacterium]